MDKKELGKKGEKIAESYLLKKGYKILEKNFLIKRKGGVFLGEIDLIAKKDDVFHFIEVKSGWRGFYEKDNFFPELKVNFQKRQKLTKLAEIWLTKNKFPLDVKWQIDVISVIINPDFKKAKICHFKNISL